MAWLPCPWNFLGKNSGVGCHSLPQGIFPTQESNSCLLHLLHCQADCLPQHLLGRLAEGMTVHKTKKPPLGFSFYQLISCLQTTKSKPKNKYILTIFLQCHFKLEKFILSSMVLTYLEMRLYHRKYFLWDNILENQSFTWVPPNLIII